MSKEWNGIEKYIKDAANIYNELRETETGKKKFSSNGFIVELVGSKEKYALKALAGLALILRNHQGNIRIDENYIMNNNKLFPFSPTATLQKFLVEKVGAKVIDYRRIPIEAINVENKEKIRDRIDLIAMTLGQKDDEPNLFSVDGISWYSIQDLAKSEDNKLIVKELIKPSKSKYKELVQLDDIDAVKFILKELGYKIKHSRTDTKDTSNQGSKMKELTLEKKIEILENSYQIILQGPPGTGKTRVAKQIAISMILGKGIDESIDPDFQIFKDNGIDKERVQLIQFHPSYSYEDFVRGIVAKSGTSITYTVENKILAEISGEANKKENKDKSYILIIDEINRANLSSVLGELIYALEYRGEPVNSMYEHPVDGREITLPKNLFIIGTMNTADRSVGSMDYALRRRFTFIDVLPIKDGKLTEGSKFSAVSKLFDEKNGYVSPEFNAKDVQLGHSYFISTEKDTNKIEKELQRKFDYQVLPILQEYVKDGVLIDKGENKIADVISSLGKEIGTEEGN